MIGLFLLSRLSRFFQLVFTTVYEPQPSQRPFLTRAQTQSTPLADVTVAVPTAKECRDILGVPLTRRGIQPVFIRVENRHSVPLRLFALELDSHYFTPLEAAGINHFSILKRISAYGVAAWYFLPLLLLLPLKGITALYANRRVDATFRSLAFPMRPIPPGTTAEGFVYTTLDAGTKTAHVCLFETEAIDNREGAPQPHIPHAAAQGPSVDLTFSLPVPGLAADYAHRNFETMYSPSERTETTLKQLIERLEQMPHATSNTKATRFGDPVNLVVIGDFTTLLSAFTARWDESETITLQSCWKTAKAFLLGEEYRYSPVSPLFLFGRSQDVALQRIRYSINERLHLRLWLSPLMFRSEPVWVGQVSRDIGVRFTTKAWNLTTHRIDPNVDEARDYVVEDLLRAERVEAIGFVNGVGHSTSEKPQRNLTGDPYFTDGKRSVIVLSKTRTKPKYVAWG